MVGNGKRAATLLVICDQPRSADRSIEKMIAQIADASARPILWEIEVNVGPDGRRPEHARGAQPSSMCDLPQSRHADESGVVVVALGTGKLTSLEEGVGEDPMYRREHASHHRDVVWNRHRRKDADQAVRDSSLGHDITQIGEIGFRQRCELGASQAVDRNQDDLIVMVLRLGWHDRHRRSHRQEPSEGGPRKQVEHGTHLQAATLRASLHTAATSGCFPAARHRRATAPQRARPASGALQCQLPSSPNPVEPASLESPSWSAWPAGIEDLRKNSRIPGSTINRLIRKPLGSQWK